MPPYQGGGDMIASVSFDETTYQEPPHRFEAGTPAIIEIIGLGAAIDYVSAIGLDRIARHEDELLHLRDAKNCARINSLKIIGTAPKKRRACISFVMQGAHPHDIGTMLDRQGIAIRAGHHCAQPLMEYLGRACHRARFFRALQYERGGRCAGRRASKSAGDFRMTGAALDSDLRDLYQDLILITASIRTISACWRTRTTKRSGIIPCAATGLVLYLKVDGQGIVRDAAFQGTGCAISVASASMMTEMLKGKTLAEARNAFRLHACEPAPGEAPAREGIAEDDAERLRRWRASGIIPMRVKCATLAWHTMQAALKNEKKVSTE